MAELRKDPMLRRWIILSSIRGKRPSDFSHNPEEDPKSEQGPCAFCLYHEDETGEETFAFRESNTKGAPDWRVRVVMNIYPALSRSSQHGCMGGEEEGPFSSCCMEGFGIHEVVIETPHHHATFTSLPLPHVTEVLAAFRHRIRELKQDPLLKYVQVFKNHGNAAGASMRHSHSQIIGLPIVPPSLQDELEGAKQHFDRTGNCFICESVDYDLKDKKRLIHESLEFIAVAPYAPRFPFETWIIPRKHNSNYEEINDLQLQDLANILQLTLRKMDYAFKSPSYNYTLQTSPLQDHHTAQYYHWHIRIVPHLLKLGGFELGTGLFINPLFPEKAAEFLREIHLSEKA